MADREKSISDSKADIDYIEICYEDLKAAKCKRDCQCNKHLQPTCVYPYPPWLPYKEILKRHIRKNVHPCTQACVKRNKVKKIKCCKNFCIEQLLEEDTEKIDPIWSRLLNLLAYTCYQYQKKEEAKKHKFMAHPLCHCFVRRRYMEAPRIPVPGWEPRRRFRGVSPPRCL